MTLFNSVRKPDFQGRKLALSLVGPAWRKNIARARKCFLTHFLDFSLGFCLRFLKISAPWMRPTKSKPYINLQASSTDSASSKMKWIALSLGLSTL
jgi:hypothetical protein